MEPLDTSRTAMRITGMSERESEKKNPEWELKETQDRFSRSAARKKKEEFPGLMENMRPGNSFPQICVVSVNDYVEKSSLLQEHGRVVHVSNRLSY
ncbi:MAG TPA: hypothetical protein VGG56_06590 [Terracidiphilus sp.]|jgi:hypothetical protein